MSVILDASVALAWLIDRSEATEIEQSNQVLRQIQRHGTKVPPLWFSEIANGILTAERRTSISSVETLRFLRLIYTLPIDQDSPPSHASQSRVLALVRNYALTAYDATYLELAIRLRLPLATFDRKLATAARSAEVMIFGDSS